MGNKKKVLFFTTAIIFFLAIIPGITHLLLEARAEAIIVKEIEKKIQSAEIYEEDVIRVEFREDVSLEEIEELLGERNIPSIFKDTPYERVEYIKIGNGELLEKMVEYSKNDLVKSVDVNHTFSINSWTPDGENRALPLDWSTSNHWYFDKIKLPEVWKQQGCLESGINCGGNSEVVVAVIDSGLSFNDYIANFEYNGVTYQSINFSKAPETTGLNLWTNPEGENANNGFCNDLHGVDMSVAYENRDRYTGNNPCNSDQFYKEGQPNDDFGHGTFVSGIITSATNNLSDTSVSIAHNISILPIKVNRAFTQTSGSRAIEEGIYYAAEYADVINISLGSATSVEYIETAINYAVSQGLVIVAASGNDGISSVSYPAAHSNTIAVGSVNNDNTRSNYSNYGAELDFVAPVGAGPSPNNTVWQETLSCLDTCDETSNFTQYSHKYGIGTSYAAPQVAAAIALIKGFDKSLTQSTVKDILISTVDDVGTAGRDDETGHGILNLENIYNSVHKLEYSAGTGGSIVGETTQNIFTGYNGSEVTATPNSGYEFDQWSDGVLTASRTDTNVTTDITVTANFNQIQHTLTYNAGEGGTISGTAIQTVANGQDGTEVTAVPNSGYEFDQWSDGVLTASRTDTNVTGDITVTANFNQTQHTLTYNAGEGGTISGTAVQTVANGQDGTEVTAVPNSGYEFDQWSDGVLTASKTDTNVTGDITVTATFVEEPTLYTLSYAHSTGGTIGGQALQLIISGEDGEEVNAIPNEGYEFIEWNDGIKTINRRDLNVTSNIFVEAQFALLIYVSSDFTEETEGWGVTHFNNISNAVNSCTNDSMCKYTISQDEDLQIESSTPFNTKQIFKFNNGLEIVFPENIEITGDASWNNILLLPRYLTQPSLDLPYSVSMVVKLGNEDSTISFSAPIRLLIPGEASKNVGYISPSGSTFNLIENTCPSDSGNSIDQEDQECRINVGEDLVIWTNHLTEFVTYEEIEDEESEENPQEDESENEEENVLTPLAQTGTGILLISTVSTIIFFFTLTLQKRKNY